MKTQIMSGGKWFDGQPTKKGERYRICHEDGGYFESFWSGETQLTERKEDDKHSD